MSSIRLSGVIKLRAVHLGSINGQGCCWWCNSLSRGWRAAYADENQGGFDITPFGEAKRWTELAAVLVMQLRKSVTKLRVNLIEVCCLSNATRRQLSRAIT